MKYRYKKRKSAKDLVHKAKAVDLLYKEMVFWSSEGKKLVQQTYDLVLNQDGKAAARILMAFKDVNDRAIDIASKLAPYQSAKLASLEVHKQITKRYVIEAPRTIKDTKVWLHKAEEDAKSLPKPLMIEKLNGYDDTIDEAEYDEINE